MGAEQLDEAKKLKANIDKRSSTVLSMLRKYLSDQVLADYDKFIKAKARLIINQDRSMTKWPPVKNKKPSSKKQLFEAKKKNLSWPGCDFLLLSHPIFYQLLFNCFFVFLNARIRKKIVRPPSLHISGVCTNEFEL